MSANVLACIDGSSMSEAVCDYASWIAQKVDAPLKLLHTIEHASSPAKSDFSGAIGLGSREELLDELTEIEQNRSKLLIKEGQLLLNAAKERVTSKGVDKFELCQRHGTLSENLIELENKLRVLVMGIRGESHDADKSGVGTQLESVIRSMHKPILVVNKEFSQPKRVMLAYDGSPCCRKALDMVASSPLFKGIPCHIVHVGEQGQDLLDEASNILNNAGVENTTAKLSGKQEVALANYQDENDIDLTLMGAFSHHRVVGFLLGSFTAKMLASTNRPLLLLR